MPKGTHRLPPLNALRAFEAAARHKSFKNAAKELHVTAGAVSHQVRLLEDHLGVALFRRLTRALELTPSGQGLLPKVQEGMAALIEAVERVRSRDGVASLTVIAPPNFAARWLVPRLSRFTSAHPDLDLHIASRPTMIDGRGGAVEQMDRAGVALAQGVADDAVERRKPRASARQSVCRDTPSSAAISPRV